jgi:Amiloride-sensitive sodium channel
MTARQVVRKFCETTTIRGIGRAIKAEKKIVSAVWWLTVAICTGFLVYQLFLVLSRYFRHDFQIVDRETNARPVSIVYHPDFIVHLSIILRFQNVALLRVF